MRKKKNREKKKEEIIRRRGGAIVEVRLLLVHDWAQPLRSMISSWVWSDQSYLVTCHALSTSRVSRPTFICLQKSGLGTFIPHREM